MRQVTVRKENPKKTAKKSTSDAIIEGEVRDIAEEEQVGQSSGGNSADTNTGKARFPLGMFSAVILSIVALASSGYLWLDSLARQQAIEERLLAHATKTSAQAALIDQRLAVVTVLERQIKEWQDISATQDAAITKLSEMVTTLSAPQAHQGQAPIKGMIAMMMWQDMKDGQNLSDYNIVLANLADGAPMLSDVVTKWQMLDFHNLLEEGYDLLEGAGSERMSDISEQSANESPNDGFGAGLAKWFAKVINLEPLNDTAPHSVSASSHQPISDSAPDRAMLHKWLSFDEMYILLSADDSPQAASWRARADKGRDLQDRLLSLSVSWLANKEPSS